MKAVICDNHGPPEGLHIAELEIAPHVDRNYSLEQYADALNALNERNVIGKIVVEI
jgi:NADPH:quinone reductase-like Zn-dependent oxidoreductase